MSSILKLIVSDSIIKLFVSIPISLFFSIILGMSGPGGTPLLEAFVFYLVLYLIEFVIMWMIVKTKLKLEWHSKYYYVASIVMIFVMALYSTLIYIYIF